MQAKAWKPPMLAVLTVPYASYASTTRKSSRPEDGYEFELTAYLILAAALM